MERLRDLLTPQLDLMNHKRHLATGGIFGADNPYTPDDPSAFDDDDVPDDKSCDEDHRELDIPSGDPDQTWDSVSNVLPVELRPLSLPSTCSSYPTPDRAVELHLRIQQAERTIQALRDAIADKSFQYSDIIRVAPRKHVRTRARATITKLNYVIAYHSQIYCHCRAAMVRLGVDQSILDRYQVLLQEHVKSSSALLNPNEAGSSRLRLSWIWQSRMPGNSASIASLRECLYPFSRCCSIDLPFQLTGCTGFGPGHRNIAGRRNTHW